MILSWKRGKVKCSEQVKNVNQKARGSLPTDVGPIYRATTPIPRSSVPAVRRKATAYAILGDKVRIGTIPKALPRGPPTFRMIVTFNRKLPNGIQNMDLAKDSSAACFEGALRRIKL